MRTFPRGFRLWGARIAGGEWLPLGYTGLIPIAAETFERLERGDTEGLPGIPAWTSGIQTFSWVVPEDGTSWAFGCTVPDYHLLMNGQLMIVGGF